MTGGGCTLLRLSNMVDAFKATLTDDEQKVGGRTAGARWEHQPRCIGKHQSPACNATAVAHPLPHPCLPKLVRHGQARTASPTTARQHCCSRLTCRLGSAFCAQIGADIVKRALPYSLKLIANNAGDNGSVVMQVHCMLQATLHGARGGPCRALPLCSKQLSCRRAAAQAQRLGGRIPQRPICTPCTSAELVLVFTRTHASLCAAAGAGGRKPQLRLQRCHRPVRGPDEGGHHRPRQGEHGHMAIELVLGCC